MTPPDAPRALPQGGSGTSRPRPGTAVISLPVVEQECATCAWFASTEYGVGDCRRRSPVVHAHSDEAGTTAHTFWPTVHPQEFCGEWKLSSKAVNPETL